MTGAARGLLVLLLAATAAAGWWFADGYVWPDAPAAFDDGPVVVLGGNPERPAFAAELTAGTDREVVVSWAASGWHAAGRSCEEPQVTCIRPEPVSTWGEAQAVGRLAAERGWERVTVVTSGFHRARAGSVVRRCVSVPVVVTGPDGPRVPVELAVREAGATVASAVLHRDCGGSDGR